MKYINADQIHTEIEQLYNGEAPKHDQQCDFDDGYFTGIWAISKFIDSLQQEMPDKETILRICKLHKAWSIMAPWENVEDFVMTNWNSENIV